MPRKSLTPSRDEGRVLRRMKRKAGKATANVTVRRDSRDRLNALRDLLKVDDQSMAIDVAWMRITGRAIE